MEEKTELLKLTSELFSIIPGHDHAGQVEVVYAESLTQEEFQKNWVDKNRPCLVKGAVKNWPAVVKWKNKEYWIKNCKNFNVTIYPHPNYTVSSRQEQGSLKMGFHEAVERLYSKQDNIFSFPGGQIRDEESFAKVFNKEDLPGFTFLKNHLPGREYPTFRFFMYRKALTAWHAHEIDETLMCQISGPKRVALFSPHIKNAKEVTHFIDNELQYEGKSLDTANDLKPVIAEVLEGDALYIPPFWHHAVAPMDTEIGYTLAYCWGSPIHVMGDFSNYFVKYLYRSGIWPRNIITKPFIALYAAVSYALWKIRN